MGNNNSKTSVKEWQIVQPDGTIIKWRKVNGITLRSINGQKEEVILGSPIKNKVDK